MRKLIILLVLFSSCNSFAFSPLLVCGGGISTGCTRASVWTEDFEAVADGEEWSNDGNWFEVGATTDVFVGDNAQANSGLLSGLVLNTAGGSMIYRAFTEITSGYANFEYYVRWNVGSGVTQSLNFVVSDDSITSAANQRVEFQVDVSGNLQINDNATWQTITTISGSTWTKVEVQINTDQTDGIDAVQVWVNGTEGTNSPYDTRGRTNPAGIDRLGYGSDSSANAWYWIDDIEVYTGVRCVQ